MSDRETLFAYRWQQAQATLADAQNMLGGGITARSIVNRAYYAMFYAVLALFIRTGLQLNTSKHAGVIGAFDREFVHNGRIEREYSRSLHELFDERQEFDYKELSEVTGEDARAAVEAARAFITRIAAMTG